MKNYNFTIENITTQTRTIVNQSDLKTITKILKEFEAKEKKNIGNAEEITAKNKRTKKSFNPIETPKDISTE